MPEDNKTLVRRFVTDFQAAGKAEVADELAAADLTHHSGPAWACAATAGAGAGQTGHGGAPRRLRRPARRHPRPDRRRRQGGHPQDLLRHPPRRVPGRSAHREAGGHRHHRHRPDRRRPDRRALDRNRPDGAPAAAAGHRPRPRAATARAGRLAARPGHGDDHRVLGLAGLRGHRPARVRRSPRRQPGDHRRAGRGHLGRPRRAGPPAARSGHHRPGHRARGRLVLADPARRGTHRRPGRRLAPRPGDRADRARPLAALRAAARGRRQRPAAGHRGARDRPVGLLCPPPGGGRRVRPGDEQHLRRGIRGRAGLLGRHPVPPHRRCRRQPGHPAGRPARRRAVGHRRAVRPARGGRRRTRVAGRPRPGRPGRRHRPGTSSTRCRPAATCTC